MYKFFVTLAILAAARAAPPHHQATSFASFNDNHNSVHHHPVESVPAKYAAHLHEAPAKFAFPAALKVAVPSAPVYYSAPAPQYYKAAPVVASAPAYYKHHHEEEVYADAPAKYEFAYAIEDGHTGDAHSQQEHRDGDHVVGQYSLHEADGTVRTVKYSDEGHGFNAVVEREGHPTEAPVYKKVVAVAAPHYYHH